MRTLAAVLGIALTWGGAAAAAPSPTLTSRAAALQEHRSAGHQSPEHHLQEARRALDRAWDKAKKRDRESLDSLRADFAALALAYAKVPTDARASDGVQPARPRSGDQAGAPVTSTPARPDVPPKTTDVVLPPAGSSAKPPLAWQERYAEVERDLKAFDTADRALKTRIDHVRTHLQMFYASALGTDKENG